MRFLQKVLFSALFLFLCAFDIGIYTIISKSFELNLSMEVERALSEHSIIANGMFESLNAMNYMGIAVDEEIYINLVHSYAAYYSGQMIEFQLWKGSRLLFPAEGNYEMPVETVAQIDKDGKGIIQISKTLPPPYDDILLVYERNISLLYESQRNLNRFSVISSLITAICLLIFLYIIIRGLTKPLQSLKDATRNIADGNFNERAMVKTKDEFGELSDNFNKMAQAVEGYIEELKKTADEKQRLADNLAHEIRTPLTAIQGFADYLVSANADADERFAAVSYIKSESQRLSRLTNTMLKMASLRKDEFSLVPVSIKELFNAVSAIKRPLLERQSQTFIINTNLTDTRVLGDFELLVSFLSNCIDNASYASKEGTEITLSAFIYEGSAVLEVCDTGCGMNEEQAKQAFDTFYRADKSRSRHHGGAGLGLALCKQIAELFDAKVNLQSSAREGTKIQIILQLDNNF